MRCTCGADLPLDARFCHRCGKPQRDEDIVRDQTAPTAPAFETQPAIREPSQSIPAALIDVSFSNKVALKIALLVAIMTILLRFLFGMGGPADILYLVALGIGGAYSVYLYKRRTGVELSTLNGARLGWFTGFFGFLIFAVFFAIAALAMTDPAIVVDLKNQVKASGLPEESLSQLLDVLKSPSKLAATLALTFIMFTLAPTCGGALTARLLKSRPTANS